MVAMVEIKQLTKCFKSITAVNNISFDVERGEVMGFLGPNGAGKSTTMKMIAGFLSPDQGSIYIKGTDSLKNPVAAKKSIGYLPEGAPLYGDMTPRLFLEFTGAIRGFKGAELHRRIEEVVAKVNLSTVFDQPIDTLSKGFKRRVGIAQAILHDPEILILDEPTDGLDPNQKHEVRHLIRDMAKQKAIILSTHILEEVDAVCTRAIIIAEGQIVADGDPETLQAQSPRHNSIILQIRTQSDGNITPTLAALDGVAKVTSQKGSDGLVQFRVLPKNGQNVIKSVASAVREHDWSVEEMHVEQGRLDEVFRQITEIQQS